MRKRVSEENAQATIGEAAFKYPDYGYRKIYAICRLRYQTPVSMAQVRASLRALRKERDEAFALDDARCLHDWCRKEGEEFLVCSKCGIPANES